MRLVCGPKSFSFQKYASDLDVVLFSQSDVKSKAAVGHGIAREIRRRKLNPKVEAWDFLSVALSCVCADMAGHRKQSPDGWTREFDLKIAVGNPDFWEMQKETLQTALNILTTDCWRLSFEPGGHYPAPVKSKRILSGDCVTLLSGGMDSLIGTIDRVAEKRVPVTVSQVVRGDKSNQIDFPKRIEPKLASLVMSHAARVPNGETPASQRSRSIVFLAYAALIATSIGPPSLKRPIEFFVSENGFISLNPPLTPMRLGSLSTRTTHPAYLSRIQSVFDAADMGLKIQNCYSFKTKGEMLKECADQKLAKELAYKSTSCGRYLKYNYTHCGRCIPCLVRRAAFFEWGVIDRTKYQFSDIGRNDSEHAGFDDVRAVAMAVIEAKEVGIERWMGANLASASVVDQQPYFDLVERGLNELGAFINNCGVK